MAGRLAVIGSGLMGSGIAQVSAQAGWQVTMRDVDDASLDRGMAAIRDSLGRFAAKGKISEEDAEAALGRITPTTDLDAAAEADVVVEAIFEKIEAKHEVFRTLDKICKAGTVLGTNTSAIPITQIATVTERPESVVGIHFFSPVPMMRLVELVRGYQTADETMAAARAFGLDFVPVAREPYDLVLRTASLDDPVLAPLWELLERDEFRTEVEKLGGYSCAETGRRIR